MIITRTLREAARTLKKLSNFAKKILAYQDFENFLRKFDNFFRVLAVPRRVLSIILMTRSAKFENALVITLQIFGIVKLPPRPPFLYLVFSPL